MRSWLLSVLFAAIALNSLAQAHEFKVGSLRIEHPRAKPSLAGAVNGGGFLTVRNVGKATDRLLAASSPSAGSVEVHEMSMAGGVMRMRQLTAGLAIGPGQAVELKPGGYHLMFMGLKKPFVAGQKVPVTLVFEKAGKVQVDFNIEAAANPATGSAAGGHSH